MSAGEPTTTYHCVNAALQLVNHVANLHLSVHLVADLRHLHRHHRHLVLAALDDALLRIKLVAEVQKHISHDCAHLVLNIEVNLLSLYNTRVNT